MCWALRLRLVTVQRGDSEMYRWSGLIISREQGPRMTFQCWFCGADVKSWHGFGASRVAALVMQ